MLRGMPVWPDHALFLVLVLLGPLWGSMVGFRRLMRASSDDLPRVRRSVYRTAIVVQWTLTIATLAWWWATRRPWETIGLVPKANLGLAGVAIGFAIVLVLVLRQRAQALHDDEALEEVRRKLSRLERMMPRAPGELSAFYRLSITAGICEEVLYRGFLIWYLSHVFGLIPSVIVAAAIFGLGHAYQGPRGVLTTGLVGAFFGAVYAIAGSLFVPMLMHALMDMHSGNLGYAAFRRGDELEAEAARARALEWERLARERAEADAALRAAAAADDTAVDAASREGTDAADV